MADCSDCSQAATVPGTSSGPVLLSGTLCLGLCWIVRMQDGKRSSVDASMPVEPVMKQMVMFDVISAFYSMLCFVVTHGQTCVHAA